jgi:hypothetical protein
MTRPERAILGMAVAGIPGALASLWLVPLVACFLLWLSSSPQTAGGGPRNVARAAVSMVGSKAEVA